MKTLLFALTAAALLTSCTSLRRYQAAAEQPDFTTVVYTHGTPALQSQINGAEITADLSVRGKRDLTLGLQVRNSGLGAFNFIPEKIRVFALDASGNKTPLRVLSANQVIQRNRNRNLILAGAVVATAAVAVAAAAGSDKDGPDEQPCYNYYPDADFWYTATVAPALVLETAALAHQINNTPTPPPAITIPPDGLLRRHTVFPEETLQGIIKIRAQPGLMDKILVEVPVEAGFAQFVFDRRTRQF